MYMLKMYIIRLDHRIYVYTIVSMRMKRCKDLKTKMGWSPLHVAAFHGQVACINLMLQSTADVNAKACRRHVLMAFFVGFSMAFHRLFHGFHRVFPWFFRMSVFEELLSFLHLVRRSTAARR